MANAKITELSALTTPATGDILPIVDVSDTTDAATGTTKKITLANLKASGADVDTGTEDVKFTTPKSLADAGVYQAGGTDVAITDGGTGQSTATAAFDALAPTTTQGDIIYHNGTDNVRLAKGTAGQTIKMNSGATAPEWAASITFTNGVTTRLSDAASGAVTIAHGLGVVPKKIRMTARVVGMADNEKFSISDGVYNGTTVSCVYMYKDDSTNSVDSTDTTNIIKIIWDQSGEEQNAVPTFDATNITLTWTKVGSGPSDTIYIMWEAEA